MPEPTPLSREERAAIRERVEKAWTVVDDLCQGRREWVMSIPARPGHDPDLVISDALKDIPRLLAQVEALERVASIVMHQALVEAASHPDRQRRAVWHETAADLLFALAALGPQRPAASGEGA